MKGKFWCSSFWLLILALFLCGFAETVSAAAASQPEFKIMNPRPSKPPITAIALAPRLPDLVGKTIAVVANYDPAMPPIAAALPKAVNGAKVLFVPELPVAEGQSTHPAKLDAPGVTNVVFKDFEKNPKMADAIIVGNGF
ncbi:MAG: hypothetical protein FWE89_01830 [Syntrophaceae bacterium]|nr:hypothetical protein [Syntrophaceae bacterium]